MLLVLLQWTWHGENGVRPEIVNGTRRLADTSGKGRGDHRTTGTHGRTMKPSSRPRSVVVDLSAGTGRQARNPCTRSPPARLIRIVSGNCNSTRKG